MNANRIETVLYGKRCIVDADQLKMLQRKESLVVACRDASEEFKSEAIRKIIGLNRRIRKTVQFL